VSLGLRLGWARGLPRGDPGPGAGAGARHIGATTCRTRWPRRARLPAATSGATGTSGTSTPSAAASGSSRNRREICRLLWRLVAGLGPLRRPPRSSGPRRPSTTPTSSGGDPLLPAPSTGTAPGDPALRGGRAPAGGAAALGGADLDPARPGRRADRPQKSERAPGPLPGRHRAPRGAGRGPLLPRGAARRGGRERSSPCWPGRAERHLMWLVRSRWWGPLPVLRKHGDEAPRHSARRVHQRLGPLHLPAASSRRPSCSGRRAGHQARLLPRCVCFAVCRRSPPWRSRRPLKLSEISMVTALWKGEPAGAGRARLLHLAGGGRPCSASWAPDQHERVYLLNVNRAHIAWWAPWRCCSRPRLRYPCSPPSSSPLGGDDQWRCSAPTSTWAPRRLPGLEPARQPRCARDLAAALRGDPALLEGLRELPASSRPSPP